MKAFKYTLYGLLASLALISRSGLAYEAPFAQQAPVIDANANDVAWQQATWQPIDSIILGETPTKDDFSGRFKVVWTLDRLYILAEITDDVLIDSHPDPLDHYWEDDLIEIFIDEDASGGDHHKSHNAFAYHIALDNQVVDIGVGGDPVLFNDHLKSQWKRTANKPHTVTWEIELKVYSSTYSEVASESLPIKLSAGKQLGFQVAYCDSDDKARGRDTFIASNDVTPLDGDKNRAYLTADVFGRLHLVR